MKRKPKTIEVNAIVRAPSPSGPIESRRPEVEARLKAKLHEYLVDSVPENTRKAYESDVRQFTRWCLEMGYVALPAEPGTVALYITAMSTGDVDGERKKQGTIRRAMSGIAMQHRRAGFESPVNDDVKAAFKGLRRSLGTKQVQKKPLLDDDLKQIVNNLPNDPQGLRDAALLLIGQHAALRREELERMDRDWLTFGSEGLMLEIPYSKASQAEPERIVVLRRPERCPVEALQHWLGWVDANTVSPPPHVFCQFTNRRKALLDTRISGHGVARVVKRQVERTLGDSLEYSGHSLRRGYVTQQHRNETPIEDIMAVTRHKSYDTVRRYIEREESLTRIGKVEKG